MARTSSSKLSIVVNSAGAEDHDAGARCCRFSRARDRWILQADCAITRPLDVSPGITLDGDGHTIFLEGDAERFGSAAIRATSGEIINLTVDGGALLQSAPEYFAAIALAAPACISGVTVRRIQFDGSLHSAIGIEIAAFGFTSTVVQQITLENISGAGLLLTGDGHVSLESVRSSDVTTAVQTSGTIAARVSDTVIERSMVDVLAQDQSCVRVSQSDARGVRIAENDALIHEETITFIGAGDRRKPRSLAAATGRNRLR